MNPIEFKQAMLDHAMYVHEQCMDTCLDEDQTNHNMWCEQRRQMTIICQAACQAANAWEAHVTRFSTHKEPRRVRFKRLQAARLASLRPH